MTHSLLVVCYPARVVCVFSGGLEVRPTTLGAGTLLEAVVEAAASSDVAESSGMASTTVDIVVAEVIAGEVTMLVTRSW
jgi:hypothetical protein